MDLNDRTLEYCDEILPDDGSDMRVEISQADCGTRLVDCGINTRGGLETGRMLAEVCLATLGTIELVPCRADIWSGVAVTVSTDQPVAACMASQYAGWQITGDDFFGMGSGPMRAAAGKEAIFDDIGFREEADEVIGVIEAAKLPSGEVCEKIAAACEVEPGDLTLLVAPTASLAGTVQVVARSVETALHKMHELKFDLQRVVSGFGVAPLPPVAANDLAGIGRTNDAVLYGGEATLWVTGDDASLEELGPQIPSAASKDYGEPFAGIFARYEHDFYKIDPMLFSPAVVNLMNLETGKTWRFGELRRDVIERSFSN